ncbi:MAG: YgiQ family radical SAM protein [Chloroflexota bacterium]|nr:YgiQ family radical SAM protein [Chloroflexota bacterium]
MFLPTTEQELKSLGWERPDVILVTGDAYIDSPHIGVAVIGKYLLKHGFKTAVIAQPSMDSGVDIERLGEPRLFWGVTAGCIDSMVANYTPTKRRRNRDDYTPGGVNVRPSRASIAYTNLIRRHFKNTKPIVLGGIEASLRRIAHYDYWDDAVRRSILFDSKADILAYGMAERTVVELARALREGSDLKRVRGICYVSGSPVEGYIRLPSFEEASADKQSFLRMSRLFHDNVDDAFAGFVQRHGDRYLIHNPPQPPLSTAELDEICDLDFERDVHPYYGTGEVRALETIKQSITTHRGCFGGCNFCSIAVHQGRRVVSRSVQSIIDEAERIRRRPGFNGIIGDVGGPTANMYGATCGKGWVCSRKSCLMPRPCPNLKFGHAAQIELLRSLEGMPGIRRVFVSSGIRHDMVVADKEYGERYVDRLVRHHVSGQIKLAPEHCDNGVLVLMNKPGVKPLMEFKSMFDEACAASGKRNFLTYYIIAAHPGCTLGHMQRLRSFLSTGLKLIPEQVQIFTPTPSTISTTMYYCETDMEGNGIFCERSLKGMQRQKDVLKRSG